MRKLMLFALVVTSFSCNKQIETTNQEGQTYSATNPSGIADSLLIEGEYLFFLNEEKFVPLMYSWSAELEKDSAAIKSLENARIAEIRQFAQSLNLEINDDDIYIYSFSGFLVKGLNTDSLSKFLSDTGNVSEVEPNFYMQNTRARMQSGTPILQNTRARMQQHPEWGYDEVAYTSRAVDYLGGGVPNNSTLSKIWILDSGIDTTHQDLIGLIDKTLSMSFVVDGINPPKDEDPFADCWGHGTACAGLAAAIPANAGNSDPYLIGMKGVSPGAKLVSLKVFGQDGKSRYNWIYKAIEYAAKEDNLTPGDILSFSLGGEVMNCNKPKFVGLVREVVRMKKVFFVFAAGNGQNGPGQNARNIFPACINADSIFTIGSMDLNYQTDAINFSAFSNYKSPPLDWVVPGNFIFTTYPGNQYAVMQGTSMSTALFAGLLHLTNGNVVKQAEVEGIHSEGYRYPVPRKPGPL